MVGQGALLPGMKILCPYPGCLQRIAITEADGDTIVFCPACGRQFQCPSVEKIRATDNPETNRQETQASPEPPPLPTDVVAAEATSEPPEVPNTPDGAVERRWSEKPSSQATPSEEAAQAGEFKVWVANQRDANRFCTDYPFLSEALRQDETPQARALAEAMEQGRKVVSHLAPAAKGGYYVFLSWRSTGDSSAEKAG